ncbi:MAG: hypothetical protein LBF25_01640, partial [Puniceicoccales bacterium]|nr:hypothetical protein [Puniceicoccales bacterium]
EERKFHKFPGGGEAPLTGAQKEATCDDPWIVGVSGPMQMRPMGGRLFTAAYADEWESYVKEAPLPEETLRRISRGRPPVPPRPPLPEKRSRMKNLGKIKVK